MRSCKLVLSLAVIGSIGMALVPTFAEAATSTQAAAATASNWSSFVKAHHFNFSSPASQSVYHRTTAAHGASATPNPGMQLLIYGGQTGSHSVQLLLLPEGFSTGTATITVTWGDGTTSTSTVNAADLDTAGLPTLDHTYAALGVYNVSAVIDDGAGDSATNTTVVATGSQFTPYGPTRILDTRNGTGISGPIAAGKFGHLKVVGAGPVGDTIPAGVTAVVLNVTVTEGTANGFLSVLPNEDLSGNLSSGIITSNLNFRANQNVANLVIAAVGKDGVVDFLNGASKGTVNVIADVAGYYTASTQSAYVPLTPTRMLDTRYGTGVAKGQIQANSAVTLNVANGKTIPADATAVAMNLTAVGAKNNGLITAYPTGGSVPTVSSLNYPAGSTTNNMTIVPIGTGGDITFANSGRGAVDLIGDVTGYYTKDAVTGASSYVPFAWPERYLDTRGSGNSELALLGLNFGTIKTGVQTPFPVTPASQPTTAAVFNATIVSPTGNGFLSLYPYNPGQAPSTGSSNINYLAGQTVPNLAIVSTGTVADSKWSTQLGEDSLDSGIYLSGHGQANLILDELGVYAQ
ncbi:hypothetical protein KDL01_10025 [Actinospica durhamensis]|uniref:PKD domain-containing protein n=1 Tax=Actinospica durhamensis TaxID=1508375 RepID=A0A941EMG6_9ACTN|nr:hypothetical protein [Actinospica durhamensis]MBR7833603.1 hypothetical protein [Actinospica durhamensis]